MWVTGVQTCALPILQQTDIEDDIYGTTSVNQAGSFLVHDKQTCLLLVKIIEICAGRIGEASSMMNSMDGTWFIQLASSICDTLRHKMLLSQVTSMLKYFSRHTLYQNRWVIVFIYLFQERNTMTSN